MCFAQLRNYLLTVVPPGFTRNIRMLQQRKYNAIVNNMFKHCSTHVVWGQIDAILLRCHAHTGSYHIDSCKKDFQFVPCWTFSKCSIL